MRYLALSCSIFFLYSCQQHSASKGQPVPPASEPPGAVVSNKLPDPVCEMPYDTSYKEWTVYKTDTLHFCSATCKSVFEKAPEKYMAKLGK